MKTLLFSTDNKLTKTLIFLATFALIFLIAQKINATVFAVNETGFGWAIPIRNNTDSPCSAGGLAPGTQRIVVVLRDANNGSLVTGTIRMDYGGTSTGTTFSGVNQAELDCVRVNSGVHVGVRNASGYRTWDQAAPGQGGAGTRLFNWCCGFISLNPSQDRGKTVYYNLYLVPNGGPATITAVSPQGLAAPGQIIASAGPTTPVNFQVRIGSALPQCGGGTQAINVYLRVINSSGGIVVSSDEGSFFSNFPFGSTQTFTKNLPNGTYTWYAQYHESPRRCGYINDSIPITSQFPSNYFTIQNLQPNLTAAINNPGPIIVGQNVTFSGTVTNSGTANTAGPFFVRFCIDAATCYGSVVGAIGPANPLVNPLNVGQTIGASSTNWVATAGSHTLRFCADVNGPPGAIPESNENDNCGQFAFTVVTPQPDLIVQSLSSSPGSPAAGNSMSFSATVRNSGTAPAAASQTRLRIDIGNNGSYDLTINPNQNTGALAVNGTEGESWSNVWSAVAGTHRYEICADTTNTNAESNEGNNCGSATFTVTAPRPNLTISSSSTVPAPIVSGNLVTFNATVLNTGSVVSNPSQTRLRIDLNNNGSYDITVSPNQSTGALTSAGSESETWINAWTAVTGTHRYEICADVTNTNVESSEADNCLIQIFNVAAAQPDYDVTSVTVEEPLPMIDGNNYTFRATVVNTGTANAPTNSDGRFCVFTSAVSDAVAALNCYERPGFAPPLVPPYNTPRRLANDALPAIDVGASATILSTPDFWTATGSDVKITFCADVRIANTDPETGEISEINESSLTLQQKADDNCHSSPVYTITLNNSWLKTERGDVYSQGKIDLNQSVPAGQDLADYLVISNEAIPATLDTLKNWLVGGYTDESPSPDTYGELFREFGSGAVDQTVDPTNTLPGSPGVYRYAGTVNWQSGYQANSCLSGTQDGVLVFIQGNLRILDTGPNTQYTTTCPTVIIVSGTITIEANMTMIDALLIANGRVNIQNSTDSLRVVGGIYSSLAGGSAPIFDRQVDGATGPSERLVFNPRILWALTAKLGMSRTDYREINP